mmetsp:Transcript_74135/g.221216  ORF Transcript_74135/g.221216 Transcript_74135/m.221216 type:complete len:303 (-) Transcript_74135:295-1203(-)
MCSDAQAAGGAFWGHAEDSALDGCLLLGVATAGPCGSGAGRHRRGPPGLGTGRTARRRVLRSRHVAWLRRQVSMAAAAAEPGQRKADHNAALLELPPGDFSAELCVGDPDKEESAERAGAPEGLKYEDQLPEREDWRPLTSSAGLLGKETYEDLLPLTGYAIKFAKEFVDFRVDLELPIPRSLAEGLPGVVLCIKDGEEGEDDYVSPSDEEWNSEDEFVEEHWKGNPLDVIYDAAVFLGCEAKEEHIVTLAWQAGIEREWARWAVAEWVRLGVFCEDPDGRIVMEEEPSNEERPRGGTVAID